MPTPNVSSAVVNLIIVPIPFINPANIKSPLRPKTLISIKGEAVAGCRACRSDGSLVTIVRQPFILPCRFETPVPIIVVVGAFGSNGAGVQGHLGLSAGQGSR